LDTDIREHSISEFIEFETLKRLRSLETDDPGGFLAEILEVFAEHTAGILPELKKCVSNNERDEVKRIAHNLKGSSANIGITVLSALFEELENKALDCDREVLDKLLHNIIGEFDSVSASIFKLKDEVDPNEA
jgi:HPt (histidine-containing phosphotransfer) domain-containing protein